MTGGADTRVRSTAAVVIGAEHPHVAAIVAGLRSEGVTFVSATGVNERNTRLALDGVPKSSVDEALGADAAIAVCGGLPAERAAMALRALRSGKHVLCPKPAVLERADLQALREACRETGRMFAIWFSERYHSASTLRALQLVRSGAVGNVVSVIGLGPHRLNAAERPAWLFDRRLGGGIVADLASHQFDQFVALAGEEIEILAAYADNCAHAAHPSFQDAGGCLVTSANGIRGYFQVSWLSPDGLDAWGDVRLMIQGTEGTIEVRKVLDPGGLPGGEHLILVDHSGVRREQAQGLAPDFFAAFVRDVATGHRTSFSQTAVFTVCDLAIRAQAMADEFRRPLAPRGGATLHH